MVFSELHWIPSVIAAVLTVLLALVKDRKYHKYLGFGAALFALIGLWGYVSEGGNYFGWDIHTLHLLSGAIALILVIWVFIWRKTSEKPIAHCKLGYAAAVFALIALATGIMLMTGIGVPKPNMVIVQIPITNATTVNASPTNLNNSNIAQTLNVSVPTTNLNSSSNVTNSNATAIGNKTNPKPNLNVTVIKNATLTPNVLPGVEATEFQGIKLTPISQQGDLSIKGTQYINASDYRLEVTGLVKNDLNMSYDDLLSLPAYSEVVQLNCVEGWSYTAKWTGFRLSDLFNLSGLDPSASYVMFYCADGYSTGEPLNYLLNNSILMAYGDNDVALPPNHGFPMRLVAESKYGYKWAKWVTKIEVINSTELGYWESEGYNNVADVGGPAYS